MSEEIAICLKNVSKVFKRYHRPVDRLKEILLPGKQRAEEFWALQDINLSLKKGDTVGVIGRNGSGKSTLLQIIAGTLQPNTGEVQVNGRVSALLELGSGFNPEFTGRQNVFFNGNILGLTKQEIENRFDEIAAFADIGEFIDQPVKTYSSGMFVRLAFAVAVHVDPEIFIVDEALAVGDVIFQHKCMRRIKSLMDSGVTTLFVSHDSGAVKTLCNSAFMLNEGQIYTQGVPNDVFIEYMKLVTQIELEASEPSRQDADKMNALGNHKPDNRQNDLAEPENTVEAELSSGRRGSGRATIDQIQIFHESGQLAIDSPVFHFNEQIILDVNVRIHSALSGFILGFYICDKNGNEIIGSNTQEEAQPIHKLNAGDKLSIRFTFRLPLRTGGYSLTVAGAENYTSTTCDWIDNITVFKVLPPDDGKLISALVDLPMTVETDITSRRPNRIALKP